MTRALALFAAFAALLGAQSNSFPPPISIGQIGTSSMTLGAVGTVPFTTLYNYGQVAVSGEQDVACNTTAGTRMLVDLSMRPYSTSVTSTWQFKTTGSAYLILSSLNASASRFDLQYSQVIENGECVSMNVSSLGGGGYIYGTAMSFSTASTFHEAKLIGNVDTSTHVLYTSPSPRGAYVLGASFFSNNFVAGNLILYGDASSSSTYNVYLVPSGGSPGATNLLATGSLTAATILLNTFAPMWLPPGMTVQISWSLSSSTSEWIEAAVFEP